MPWDIQRLNDEFCVIQRNSGQTVNCHATRTEAEAQMRALYASEGTKQATEDQAMEEVRVIAPSGGATSFAELHEVEEAKETAWKVRDLTWQFQDLISNIMASDDIEDKSKAVQDLTGEFIQELDRLPENKSLWDRVKELFKAKPTKTEGDMPEGDMPASAKKSFTVWKEGDVWRWMAIYSNKYRDRDDPPEILSESAHKEFVKAVDSGEWDYPELWLWHVGGTKSGQADFLAYDDQGFSIAVGTGVPEVMEALSQRDDLGVSHGMPTKEIKYDGKDPSVIVRYRTVEISPLPKDAAANELTGFATLEDDMALSEEKQKFLTELLGEERTVQILDEIGDKAKEAEGLEFKGEGSEEEPVEETQEEMPDYVTRDEVAEAVGQALSGFQEKIDLLVQGQEATAEVLKSHTETLSGLERTDEEKIAAEIKDTPAASLYDTIMSVVGQEETRIDGRRKLAKDAPEENKVARTGIPVVDELVDGDGDWRKAVEV